MKTDIYGILDFQRDFPDDDACLDYIFKKRCPDLKGYYRLKTRKAYVNKAGHQIYPLVGTIFEKSSTSLWKWFFAIFLFSASKNGVSGKELQRELKVTYKTGWRMARLIRSAMKQNDPSQLFGTVEADETYAGGSRRTTAWAKGKLIVVGIAERGGRVRAHVLKDRYEKRAIDQIVPYVYRNVKAGSTLYTDYARVYNTLTGYKRGRVMHSWKEFKNGDADTNSIEGFWSTLKRGLKGTHIWVSKNHLQSYVDEAVWRWNHRQQEKYFDALLETIWKHPAGKRTFSGYSQAFWRFSSYRSIIPPLSKFPAIYYMLWITFF